MKTLTNKIKLFLISITTVIYSINAIADLDIEITQGVSAAVPIAIYPFNINTEKYGNQDRLNVLTEVINSNLYRSGLFKPVLQSGISYMEINKLPISTLQSQEAEYIVRGVVNNGTADNYQVSFELIDLYQLAKLKNLSDSSNSNEPGKIQRNNIDYNKAVILDKTFSIPGRNLRGLGHHISDLIYEKLTGIKGIFSSKIAYVNVTTDKSAKRKYVLEVADSDGYNPQPLLISSEPIMSPSWSPDAKRIAYVSFEGFRSKVKVAELATGTSRVVSSFKGINGAPAWSPDGTKLALVLSKENVPKIYYLSLANNSLVQLTTGPSIDTEPRWSPDGRSLIFTSNRSGGPQIYRYEFANNKITRLTFDGDYNARASFTPDGKKLVMLHRGKDRGFQIAVQDLQSNNLVTLTDSSMDESPSVSANGQHVIYATKDFRNNLGILGEVSIDGRVKLKRQARNGDVQEPSWSPFLG